MCQRIGVAEGSEMGCEGGISRGAKDGQRRYGGMSQGRGRGDEPIEIIEAEEVEAELDEDFVLLRPHRPEYLCGII